MSKYNTSRVYAALLGMVFILGGALRADDWPQWRGPQRNGISEETGLLQKWPKEGPKLIWSVTNLGDGFSTPAVIGERLYVMSNKGLEDEFVKALSTTDGKEVWSVRLGKVGNPDQKPPYPGARSTPTVDGDFLYALSSDGDLACLEVGSGKVQWQKSLRKEFGGKPGIWAYSESPLVDGDAVICTPGGSEATIVALHKKTGAVIWKCATPEGDDAAYASPVIMNVAGVKQYVTLLQKGLVGVEAESGKLLWRYARPISPFNANIPTPLVSGDIVYVASAGTGGGAVRIGMSDGQFAAEELYFEAKLPTAIGGAVKVGDFLYATTSQSMLCLNFTTGEVKWQDRALGAASVCYADKQLYLHSENGDVGLVAATPEAYQEQGRFTPPDVPKQGNSRSWAYPVVSNGRLYIRDLGSLWCFDIRRQE